MMEQPSKSLQRRLAPQRKKKPTTVSKINGTNTAPIIPINLSLDIQDHVDDIDQDVKELITHTMADWTLKEHICEIKHPQDDASFEEQSYRGEIESHENLDEESSNISQEEIEVPDGYAPISLDEVSSSPPPSDPLVMVNLELLCGYKPDVSERKVLIPQIIEALYGETANNTNGDNESNSGEGLEFDTRVMELFESGVGSHVDSNMDVVKKIKLWEEGRNTDVVSVDNKLNENSIDDEIATLAMIPYPEFLSNSATLESTNRLWKLLHTPHPLPLIERVFKHLRSTSRSLFWKAEMHNQLRLLVIDEYKVMISRLASEEYEKWKVVRSERLEKLYEVRETFLLRVGMARERYEAIIEEREKKVDIEMRLRRGDLWNEEKKVFKQKACKATKDAFDEIQSYDDDGWGGVIQEDDIIGETDEYRQIAISEHCRDDNSELNEEWSPIGMSLVIEDKDKNDKTHESSEKTINKNRTINILEPITAHDNMQRKSRMLEKSVNQSHNSKTIAEEEALVRETLKTTDELMAEAMLRNLQERLCDVDNLVESIQEEEWADEEDAEKGINNTFDETAHQLSEMSLLDQILAMILGALSMTYSGANSQEEHFIYIRKEHKSISSEWKELFGRLPPTNIDEKKNEVEVDSSSAAYASVGADSKEWDEIYSEN